MLLTPNLRGNLAAIVAIDIIPVLLGILGNLVFIITLTKTRSLHTASNVLIGAMCICDLIFLCIGNPLFLAYLLMIQTGYDYRHYSDVRKVYNQVVTLCAGLSFIFAMFITVDRYFSICYPFKYQRLVNCKKYLYLVVITAIVETAYGHISLLPSLATTRIYETSVAIIQFLSFSAIIFCYARIYRVIYKKRAVISLGTFSHEETTGATARRRQNTAKTHTIFIIVGTLILCYSPLFAVSVFSSARTNGVCDIFEDVFILYQWAVLLISFNSTINPLIYFLRSKETRSAALRLFRS